MSKLSRNEKCHCNSGKKYKKCCYEIDKENELKNIEKEKYSHELRHNTVKKILSAPKGSFRRRGKYF